MATYQTKPMQADKDRFRREWRELFSKRPMYITREQLDDICTAQTDDEKLGALEDATGRNWFIIEPESKDGRTQRH